LSHFLSELVLAWRRRLALTVWRGVSKTNHINLLHDIPRSSSRGNLQSKAGRARLRQLNKVFGKMPVAQAAERA